MRGKMVRCRRPTPNLEYVGRRYPTTLFSLFAGDDLQPDTARSQAEAFRRRFPVWQRWGLSAYYARSEDEINDLAEDQLERFPLLIVLTIEHLIEAGFEIVPTFRTPHVTIAFDGDLDKGLALLVELAADTRPNPYHESEPG